MNLRQTGAVRDYIKAFSALMLDIKDMSDEDRFFHFLKGPGSKRNCRGRMRRILALVVEVWSWQLHGKVRPARRVARGVRDRGKPKGRSRRRGSSGQRARRPSRNRQGRRLGKGARRGRFKPQNKWCVCCVFIAPPKPEELLTTRAAFANLSDKTSRMNILSSLSKLGCDLEKKTKLEQADQDNHQTS